MAHASTSPAGDLVKSQANLATLNHLISKYNQLYKTYLQQVETEMSKRDKRNYPYNIKNPNEIKNTLTPATPFPSNGTEDACFKSCIDTADCVHALYSNSGCGIDCNPNKCLLYGAKADGIVPVDELPTNLPTCPASGDTDAWCKTFNHPATNAIIPVLVLRTGDSFGSADWRTLAMQMPKSMANAADAPMSVDLTTNVQTWGPDAQFSDVNAAPENEISLQFRFFCRVLVECIRPDVWKHARHGWSRNNRHVCICKTDKGGPDEHRWKHVICWNLWQSNHVLEQ